MKIKYIQYHRKYQKCQKKYKGNKFKISYQLLRIKFCVKTRKKAKERLDR